MESSERRPERCPLSPLQSTLEELGERVNGDLRMAVNQLEYMALRSRHLSSEGVKSRALSSAKDEDLRPMAAVDKLLSAAAGRERLEARLDAALSDIDLLPLMIAENYLNHRPTTPPNDPEGVLWMEAAARAADSISEGDRVNVAVRRYQRWQHLPFAAFMGCVLPGALMHGARSTLAAGEMNFTRFPGWLGKNSTHTKNRRRLEEVHAHMLASRLCSPSRQALRLDYLLALGRRLTDPLRTAPKVPHPPTPPASCCFPLNSVLCVAGGRSGRGGGPAGRVQSESGGQGGGAGHAQVQGPAAAGRRHPFRQQGGAHPRVQEAHERGQGEGGGPGAASGRGREAEEGEQAERCAAGAVQHGGHGRTHSRQW